MRRLAGLSRRYGARVTSDRQEELVDYVPAFVCIDGPLLWPRRQRQGQLNMPPHIVSRGCFGRLTPRRRRSFSRRRLPRVTYTPHLGAAALVVLAAGAPSGRERRPRSAEPRCVPLTMQPRKR